jgi:CBS domain-containing protein
MLRMAKRTLSGLLVRHAMRRQVIALPQETAIDPGINHLIKYKVNALLVTGARGAPVGVVSKSDIMGAYYAGLSSSSPLEHIMAGPPLFCRPDEALETALDTMRNQGVYRLYVTAEDEDRIIGVLAYKHHVDPETPASGIMSAPVQLCRMDDLLEDAIKTMIYADVRRLFVTAASAGGVEDAIIGVFSLSDAARIRSGSCHACLTSRIQLDNSPKRVDFKNEGVPRFPAGSHRLSRHIQSFWHPPGYRCADSAPGW